MARVIAFDMSNMTEEEVHDKLEYILMIEKTQAALPNTVSLLTLLRGKDPHSRQDRACAACILLNSEVDGVHEFILPEAEDYENSLEHTIDYYRQMGRDAPMYIQNLYDTENPALREQAITELGQGAEKSREWIVFKSIEVLKKMECPNPEHDMQMSGAIIAPMPDTEM